MRVVAMGSHNVSGLTLDLGAGVILKQLNIPRCLVMAFVCPLGLSIYLLEILSLHCHDFWHILIPQCAVLLRYILKTPNFQTHGC